MKHKLVVVPPLKTLIKKSPGFDKKELSSYKLDILALCQFACRYCSSNNGNYLRINQERFADATEEQTGQRTYPADDPSLMFVWEDVVANLERELASKAKSYGAGHTLVFSMLTDGFSPYLVQMGITEAVLRLVMERSSFRVRILTKNSVVGTAHWVSFFNEFPGRFVVGLSTGTSDDAWSRRIEVGTSSPTARLRALRALQDVGVPTYGMMCPVFPDMLEGERLDALIDKIQPELCEDVWAEPFNDRANWEVVRGGYAQGSFGHRWMTEVYEKQNKTVWSRYATDLYVRLRDRARRDGWMEKLKYLLYEGNITQRDAPSFTGFEGCLLQSKKDEDGHSKNPHIAALEVNPRLLPPAGTTVQAEWLRWMNATT